MMQAELTKPSLATPEHPIEISGSQAVLEAFIAELVWYLLLQVLVPLI
jgi:hypothetical protein